MATTVVTEQAWELTDLNEHSASSSTGPWKKDEIVPKSDHQRRQSEEVAASIELPPPTTAVHALQRWNSPRGNIPRVFAAFYAFLVVGMNDAAYGPLIPSLEKHYDLSYTVVSLIFLSPFVGYSLAALSNSTVHLTFGQRGIAIIGPLCHLIPYIVISFHPPYGVLIAVYTFIGYGTGLEDSGWCAWIGHMAYANRLQGFLHGFYSLGGTISPLIATSMINKAGLPWYTFYYLMSAAAAVELATSAWAFWPKTAAKYREETSRQSEEQGGRTREALKSHVTWLCALFFLAYMGAEVSLGGWVVTFMNRIRLASSYQAGMSATGFWAGMTVGRAGLGFVTEHFGERVCVCVYLACAIALELIFWLVPKFIVSAIAVAFLGFFLGPLFPACIVMAAKLLPRHLHVSAIGFATALGGVGGAVMPFATGAIAQAKGVQVLQPIVLALLAVVSGTWLLLPRVKKRAED